MITIAKTILGLSALASAGAMTVVAPEAPAAATPAPAPMLIPTVTVNGKVANRLPSAAEQRIASAEAVARIRIAHSPSATQQPASLDCRVFSWPHIPTECLTTTDGSTPRRPARVIGAQSE